MNPDARAAKTVLASTLAGLALLATSAACPPAFAQVPGGAAQESGGNFQPERDKDYGTARLASGKTAEEMARDYVLHERGWDLGRNGDPETGFVVMIGTGAIESAGRPQFDPQRRMAFQRAMTAAKEAMARELALRVQTKFEQRYSEGQILDEPAPNAPPAEPAAPGALEKIEAILQYEIDQELKKRNIDPSLLTPEQRKEEAAARSKAAQSVISSSSDAIGSAAEHEVSGLQAFRTFESISEGGSGQIAVVAIHSRKTEALQRALMGLQPAPESETPGQRISAWAAKLGSETLLYTHGTQIRTNERGELVLVAFGQSTPGGSSQEAQIAAGMKAQEQAVGAMRRFMGELVRSTRATNTQTTLREFEDDTSEFEAAETFTREVMAEAKELEMPGLQEVYVWEARHPQSDRVTKGSVYAWSVSSAEAAKKLSSRLNAARGSEGGAGIGAARPRDGGRTGEPKNPPKGTPSGGAGAEGETP